MNVKLGRLAGVALLVIAAACSGAPDESTPPAASESEDEAVSLGTVDGRVRDHETGEPLSGVWVSVGDFGATSDSQGSFLLGPLPAGPAKLHAYRRGFRAESATVVVPAGGSAGSSVSLEPANPPCCRLGGSWSARFHLDSAGLNARPDARELAGRLTFEAGIDTGRTRENAGAADIDFGPLLGSESDGRLREGRGLVFSDDSVAVTLIPSFGDWAIELLGRQDADTIRGSWHQRASCCGAYGTFVLVRDS